MIKNMLEVIKLVLNKISSYRKSSFILGAVNVIFILLFFIAPSDKTVFVVAVLHLVVILVFSKSVLEGLVHLYWPWYVFESGRDFSLILVPLEHILSDSYTSPVSLPIVFSPFILLTLCLAIVVAMLLIDDRNLNIFKKKWFILGFLFILVRMVSSVVSVYSIPFSFFSVYYQSVAPMVWVLGVLLLSSFEKKRFLVTSILTLGCMFCLEFLLSIAQMVSGGFIGIHAERAWYTASFGSGSDESSTALRVAGFWFHPNAMANWMLQEGIVLVLLYQQLFGKKSFVSFLALSIILVLLSVTSLTRTVFVTLAFFPIIFFTELKKVIQVFILFFMKVKVYEKSILIGLTLFLFFLASPRLIERVLLSAYSFADNGGITTRGRQYSEAWQLLQIKPFFGHGPGMYTAALFSWLPEGEIRYFPEKVHNSFLLIAVESGIPSLVLALLFISSIIALGLTKLDKKTVFVWLLFNSLYMLLQPAADSLFALVNLFIIILAEFKNEKKILKKY